MGAIHSTKISGNFDPKLNGSVRSNRKSFEKTGPPFEVVHFSRSDRLEFWLNGSRPISRHSNFFLPSFAKDIKDGHGLKLEKVAPSFSSLNAMPVKIAITHS